MSRVLDEPVVSASVLASLLDLPLLLFSFVFTTRKCATNIHSCLARSAYSFAFLLHPDPVSQITVYVRVEITEDFLS